MTIQHFEDLHLDDLLSVLSLEWTVTEKLDGSYLEFGLDELGFFYTRRKGAEPCYHVNDWPNEGWTRSFRLAHTAAECVADFLVRKGYLKEGDVVGCEALYGNIPNTIVYRNEATLAITVIPDRWDIDEVASVLNSFEASFIQDLFHSSDGLQVERESKLHKWRVVAVQPIHRLLIKSRLEIAANALHDWLEKFLASPSMLPQFTVRECLLVKLNKRPDKVAKEDWSHIKKILKFEREHYCGALQTFVMPFKDKILRSLSQDIPSVIPSSSYKEGVVIAADNGVVFKVTDRKKFTAANKFSHLVKYWLVGGRRPGRPSFLSRTKDWPKEKRLQRLEVLRQRYMLKHDKIREVFLLGNAFMYLAYEDELHERMKLLFADIKDRIENGR